MYVHVFAPYSVEQYFHMVNLAEIEKVNLKMMTCSV